MLHEDRCTAGWLFIAMDTDSTLNVSSNCSCQDGAVARKPFFLIERTKQMFNLMLDLLVRNTIWVWLDCACETGMLSVTVSLCVEGRASWLQGILASCIAGEEVTALMHQKHCMHNTAHWWINACMVGICKMFAVVK